MTDDALQLLADNAEYATLLRSYERARTEIRPDGADGEEAGWTPRLAEVDGIDCARLAPMHGKLIAHGLLSFQLTGRTSGVVYRVSPDGRDALRRLSGAAPEPAADDDDFFADVAA